jgi:hypothetical protein
VALRTFYPLALIIPLLGLGLGALRSPYYVVGTVVWLSPDALLRFLVLYPRWPPGYGCSSAVVQWVAGRRCSGGRRFNW